MTKRILALLLAALMAVTCMMFTACGDDTNDDGNNNDDAANNEGNNNEEENNDGEDETSDPATSDGDETSDPVTSDPATSDIPVIETPLTAFEGEEKMAELYSAGFECWNGYWQACVTINKDELDATENVGTEDYAYEWHVAARVADSSDEWMKVQAQLDTLYDFDVNAADANVIYRLQLGTWTNNLVVDTEYEFVIQTKKNGEWLTKSLIYVTWTQDYVDQYNYWVTGVDKDGNAIERKVPTIPPVEGVDFA